MLDAVVISTAIPESNPEVVAARERGIPVLRRADALRAIVATRTTIAVAGSHGKTTTSSMLALILRAAGWHPSFLIGGDLNEVGTNAVFDSGEWLVVEADESDGTFLRAGAPRRGRHLGAARPPRPLRRLPGPRRRVRARSSPGSPASCALCADDDASPPPSPRARPGATVTYGFAAGRRLPDGRLRGRSPRHAGSRSPARGEPLGAVELPVPGRHNAVNAAGAAAIGAGARGALRRGHERARRASAASPVASSSGASATASPTSTTTRTSRATSTP